MTDFNWIFWIVAPIIIIYFLYQRVWPVVRKVIRVFKEYVSIPVPI